MPNLKTKPKKKENQKNYYDHKWKSPLNALHTNNILSIDFCIFLFFLCIFILVWVKYQVIKDENGKFVWKQRSILFEYDLNIGIEKKNTAPKSRHFNEQKFRIIDFNFRETLSKILFKNWITTKFCFLHHFSEGEDDEDAEEFDEDDESEENGGNLEI